MPEVVDALTFIDRFLETHPHIKREELLDHLHNLRRLMALEDVRYAFKRKGIRFIEAAIEASRALGQSISEQRANPEDIHIKDRNPFRVRKSRMEELYPD